MTSSTPGNQSELQLYRVLQRANLLQYYDTFIAQGGDDVQQLCEAGEDEFLEIMALVGMASKPLHVRRLQKALQEWVTNPDDFCTPAMFQSTVGSPAPGSITAAVQRSGMPVYPPAQPTSQAQAARPVVPETVPTVVTAPTWSPQVARPTNMDSVSPSPSASYTYTHSPGASHDASNNSPPQLHQGDEVDLRRGSPQPTPVLVESQIRSIAEAAEKLVPNLPHFEPKPLNMRKQINQEIEKSLMQALPRHRWTEETMLAACQEIILGRLSIRKASDAYGIPRDSLQKRVMGRLPSSVVRPGPRTILTPEEEDQIVQYCLEKRSGGRSVTGMDCRRLAFSIAEASGRSHPFSNGMAGADWFDGFRNRHPDLPFGKGSHKPTPTRSSSRTILTPDEEGQIVEFWRDSRAAGKTVTGLDCRRKAFKIAEASGRLHPFRNGIAGYDWFEGFKSRHPEVCLKKSAAIKPLKVNNKDYSLNHLSGLSLLPKRESSPPNLVAYYDEAAQDSKSVPVMETDDNNATSTENNSSETEANKDVTMATEEQSASPSSA